MGCGVSRQAQVAVNSTSDEMKSQVFVRLVSEDRNPLAVHLARYFQNLLTECRYRSHGDLEGYERMVKSRKASVVVTPSLKDAEKHGIGKEPLSSQSVYSIVELFLGYAMLSLQKEKWDGAFFYKIERRDPSTGSILSLKTANRDTNLLVITNNKRVVKDPVGAEGFLEVEGTIDYPTIDKAQTLHCNSRVRFDFFLLDDVKLPGRAH